MFKRLLQYKILEQKSFYDREKYENILRDPKSILGNKLNRFVTFCVLLSVGIIIIETVPEIGYSIDFLLLDIAVSLVFAIEYAYRFFRAKSKSHFVSRPFNVIDLLSFAPFFLGIIFAPLAGLDFLKILRLFRILRLFEISSHSPIALGFMRTIHEYRREYRAIFSIFLSILLMISTFVYYFEFPVNASFSSIPQSLWWGIVTMSTVGYGDMAPITLGGRVLGVFLILLGPVLLAVISSITILVFMDVAEGQKRTDTKICTTCKTRNPEDANFCFNCGAQHFTSIIQGQEKSKKIAFLDKLFTKK